MTDASRIEPGILLIGGMRCGSTSLFRHLGRHPDVHESATKEPRFFNHHFERGWAWYEQRLGAPAGGAVVLEATPSYLASPVALERIAEELPAAHLIVSLRDPVDRAYSHYWMKVARESEQRSFVEAVDADLVDGRSDEQTPYLHAGRYGPQLRRLYELVPRDRVHVVVFEEYRREPARVGHDLVASLGLQPVPDLEPPGQVNSYQRFRSVRLRALTRRLPKPLADVVGRLNRVDAAYPEMDSTLRARLDEHFAESSREAAELTGLDLAAEWPSLRGA